MTELLYNSLKHPDSGYHWTAGDDSFAPVSCVYVRSCPTWVLIGKYRLGSSKEVVMLPRSGSLCPMMVRWLSNVTVA